MGELALPSGGMVRVPYLGWHVSIAFALAIGAAGAGVAYVLLFGTFYVVLGPWTSILSLLPVTGVGWFLRGRAGLSAGLMMVAMNTLLLMMANHPDLTTTLAGGTLPATTGLLLVGTVVGWLGDSRKQIRYTLEHRKQVAEETQRLLLAVAATSDGVVMVDMDGRISFTNRAADQLYGYAPGGMVGMEVWNIHGTASGTLPPRQIFEAALARGDWTGESFGKTKTGQELPIRLHASLMRDHEWRPVGLVIVITDMTERKRAEEALAHQAQELARSNQDLQLFASVASHDLQEPLRTISSYVQLLANRYGGALDADADEFIAYAVDGARRMQHLIDALLAYTQVGTQDSEYQLVDASSLLYQVVNDLQGVIVEAGAQVTHDPLPTLLADPSQLARVFQNLLTNAIKFHGPQPSRVHVSAERQGQAWLFSVRDNGMGIAPEHADRIFTLFQRLNTRTTYPGTGISLAICKRIVERHGGRIWVASEPAQGATFSFTIRAPEGSQPQPISVATGVRSKLEP